MFLHQQGCAQLVGRRGHAGLANLGGLDLGLADRLAGAVPHAPEIGRGGGISRGHALGEAAVSVLRVSGPQAFDIVAKIAQRSIAFGKPVLLMQGDSHGYKVDKPLDGSVASAGMRVASTASVKIVVRTLPRPTLRSARPARVSLSGAASGLYLPVSTPRASGL
mgnify:CR=1 FL=1